MPPNDQTPLVGRKVFIRLPGKPVGVVEEEQRVDRKPWAYVKHEGKSIWYPKELVELMPQ